jgi:hypothetical protein
MPTRKQPNNARATLKPASHPCHPANILAPMSDASNAVALLRRISSAVTPLNRPRIDPP